jgi:hypothetical protein
MTKRTLLALTALGLLTGCQSLRTPLPKLSWTTPEKELPKEAKHETGARPTRLVALWSDALYSQAGQAPIRGFGGRLYFYDPQNQAVPVTGQLIVYGYDDSIEGTPAKSPARKFVFTAEQLAQHYSPTELGASYSVWLPWEPVGGEKKAISLLPIFTGSDGVVLSGQQAVNVLPGRTPERVVDPREGRFSPTAGANDPSVRPASHEQLRLRDGWEQMHPFTPQQAQAGAMRSTTIRLPMATPQRLVQSGLAQPAAARVGSETQPTASEPEPLPPEQPAGRFVRPRYQAPRGAASPGSAGRAPTSPSPSAPPSDLPWPPSPNPWPSPGGYPPDAPGRGQW